MGQAEAQHWAGAVAGGQGGEQDLDEGVGESKGQVTPAQLSLGEAQLSPEVRLDHPQGLAEKVGGAVGEPDQEEGDGLARAD